MILRCGLTQSSNTLHRSVEGQRGYLPGRPVAGIYLGLQAQFTGFLVDVFPDGDADDLPELGVDTRAFMEELFVGEVRVTAKKIRFARPLDFQSFVDAGIVIGARYGFDIDEEDVAEFGYHMIF